MSIKVLVFESDSAFAGELRNELGNLGCAVRVVDDGNVGLQQAQSERPDLILLSIELPRMNGFSVCNKLKKDPDLKDIPLIIMSSESSDETFDQHKKLRTRAEAYVHKPITFPALVREIDPFVSLRGGDDGLASTGDIDVGDVDVNNIEIDDDDATAIPPPPAKDSAPDSARTVMFKVPSVAPREVDPDIDAFADDAFGRLQAPADEPPQHHAPSTRPPPATQAAAALAASRAVSPTPPPPSDDASEGHALGAPSHDQGDSASHAVHEAELEQVRAELGAASGELDAAKAQAAALERQLQQAQEEASRALGEAEAETERLKRELEELRLRPAPAAMKAGSVPPKAGAAVSSREFLDLREALSKKDKEILALKQQQASKDRELFETRERSLVHESRASELDDKVLAKDRELAEASEKLEDVSGQLDVKTRTLSDTQTELDRLEKEHAELRARRDQENVTHEAATAALKADHTEAQRRLSEEHAAAMTKAQVGFKNELDAADATHTAARDDAEREHTEALAKAAAIAEDKKAAAIAAREAELKAETDTKLASLHRSQQDELQRLRTDAEGRETALKDDLGKTKAKVEELGTELAEVTAARSSLETQLGASASKTAALEEELEALRGELDETRKNLVRESSRATRALAKWDADKASLERAKDALAVALSQLDEAEARPISE